MGRNPLIGIRFPPELLDRLDRYAAQLAQDARIPVTRQAAVLRLLTAGLDLEDSRTGRPKRPSSRAVRR